ncbi:MAG: flavodoxin family protein [Planctomycetota bacterium]|nr:MAG: flavodoxin family protein [Planctomycetota bacterium]
MKESLSPRILCIHASERARGNSRALYDEAIKGAESAGARIERLAVRDLEFEPCISCNGCDATGECVIHDDMHRVYALLRECDRFLIASPIYFWSLPGRFKCLIDRCQAFWVKKFVLGEKVAANASGMERRAAFISVCGFSDGDKMFPSAEKIIRAFLSCIDVKLTDTLYVPGADRVGAVLEKPELLKAAFQTGRSLAAPTP